MHTVTANGADIPALGFGTWTLVGDDAERLVAHALDNGYRHIDTAAMYDNEEAVGRGIRAAGVSRKDIFLTTKIWYPDIADGDLQASLEASLGRLGTDYVDLALIHWPSKTIPLGDSIKALNDTRNKGLARHIGVSNFTLGHIEEATSLSEHPLACNQVEYHPFLNQDLVLDACRKHGMALVSYCPLYRGGPLFASEQVKTLCKKHGRTPAQIVLRWHVQQDGVAAIPRSQNPERIVENLQIFDFELEPADMASLSALSERQQRLCDYDFSPTWD